MPAAASESDLQALLDGASDPVSLDRVIGELVQSFIDLPQPYWSLGPNYIRGAFSGVYAVQDFTAWVDEFNSHVESLECIGDWHQLESRFYLRSIPVQITAFGSSEAVSSHWVL